MIVCDRSRCFFFEKVLGIPIVATFRLLSFEGFMADVQWRSAWLTGGSVRCQVSSVGCQVFDMTPGT